MLSFPINNVQGSNGSVLSKDICAVNERVRGSISGEEGSAAVIELWYKRTDVFYRATCYFWDVVRFSTIAPFAEF